MTLHAHSIPIPADLPLWRHVDGTTVYTCAACGYLDTCGFLADLGDSGLFICTDCASDLSVAHLRTKGLYASRNQQIQLPMVPVPSQDVSLTLRFTPGDSAVLTEITCDPEPPDVEGIADVLAEAYARLAEYTTAYLAAMGDDLPAMERREG
jgi:hypothetical protein